MKISVIHPSRSRAEQAYKTASNWHNKADNSYEYILSLDNSDPLRDRYYMHFENFNANRIVNGIATINDNSSAIEAINAAAKIATGDILVIISDDFDCPEHWDTILLKLLQDKSDFCVKTVDRLQPTLITMPIMDRIYYERYGYIYHPDYKHMFADQELTSVALMTGKYIELQVIFPHLHYSTGLTPKDEINVKNDLTWKQGENLFNERLKTNFSIKNPVINYTDIQWR